MALTGRQSEAAALMAADLLTDEDIARRVGVTRKTLYNWRQQPQFTARIDAVKGEIRATATVKGIALVGNRVAALNDRWERMKAVITARAEDETMAHVPGGTTGLLVRTYKSIKVVDETEQPEVDEELEGQPHGGALKRRRKDGSDAPRSIEVAEYAVDTGLLKELREHEKQASMELGTWLEKQEVTQRGAVTIRTITAVQPSLSAPSEE